MKADLTFFETTEGTSGVKIRLIPESDLENEFLEKLDNFPSKKTFLSEVVVYAGRRDFSLILATGYFGQDLADFLAEKNLFDLVPQLRS